MLASFSWPDDDNRGSWLACQYDDVVYAHICDDLSVLFCHGRSQQLCAAVYTNLDVPEDKKSLALKFSFASAR